MVEERRKVDSNADLSHRISMLESGQAKLEERTINTDKRVELLEKSAINAEERLDAMNEVHIQTMATLSKMQITLEQLNEVLTTFNKWKYTKKGIREIGEVVIWAVKVALAGGILWGALSFNHSNNTEQPNKAVSTMHQEKTLIEKFEDLDK